MKVSIGSPQAATHGIKSNTFSIKQDNKAFRAFSDGLYSDKPLAIVRELTCNAVDAHRDAGTMDTPYKLFLPHDNNPKFVIRDYGTGLSPEQFASIYTVYGESTKDKSNDNIGGFGLGSKTPFAYTDQYFVRSYWNGNCYTYVFFFSEDQPEWALVATEPTTLANGLEIYFDVDEADFGSFFKAAQKIVPWLPVLADVYVDNHIEDENGFFVDTTATDNNTVGDNVATQWFDDVTKSICAENDDIRIINNRFDDRRPNRISINQGGVLYPTSIDELKSNIPDSEVKAVFAVAVLQGITAGHQSVILNCPIGTVELTRSRESVSWTKHHSIPSMTKWLTKLGDTMVTEFVKTISTVDDGLDIATLYNSLINRNSFEQSSYRQSDYLQRLAVGDYSDKVAGLITVAILSDSKFVKLWSNSVPKLENKLLDPLLNDAAKQQLSMFRTECAKVTPYWSKLDERVGTHWAPVNDIFSESYVGVYRKNTMGIMVSHRKSYENGANENEFYLTSDTMKILVNDTKFSNTIVAKHFRDKNASYNSFVVIRPSAEHRKQNVAPSIRDMYHDMFASQLCTTVKKVAALNPVIIASESITDDVAKTFVKTKESVSRAINVEVFGISQHARRYGSLSALDNAGTLFILAYKSFDLGRMINTLNTDHARNAIPTLLAKVSKKYRKKTPVVIYGNESEIRWIREQYPKRCINIDDVYTEQSFKDVNTFYSKLELLVNDHRALCTRINNMVSGSIDSTYSYCKAVVELFNIPLANDDIKSALIALKTCKESIVQLMHYYGFVDKAQIPSNERGGLDHSGIDSVVTKLSSATKGYQLVHITNNVISDLAQIPHFDIIDILPKITGGVSRHSMVSLCNRLGLTVDSYVDKIFAVNKLVDQKSDLKCVDAVPAFVRTPFNDLVTKHPILGMLNVHEVLIGDELSEVAKKELLKLLKND